MWTSQSNPVNIVLFEPMWTSQSTPVNIVLFGLSLSNLSNQFSLGFPFRALSNQCGTLQSTPHRYRLFELSCSGLYLSNQCGTSQSTPADICPLWVFPFGPLQPMWDITIHTQPILSSLGFPFQTSPWAFPFQPLLGHHNPPQQILSFFGLSLLGLSNQCGTSQSTPSRYCPLWAFPFGPLHGLSFSGLSNQCETSQSIPFETRIRFPHPYKLYFFSSPQSMWDHHQTHPL